jgi:mono/diheme cytochrome c family protein
LNLYNRTDNNLRSYLRRGGMRMRRPNRLVWLGVILFLSACQQQYDEMELVRQGEEVYISNCARCHQLDGEGFADAYPPLANNPIVTLHDPNFAIDAVIHGQGAMPPFGPTLSNEEIAAVVSYIRSAWGNEASIVEPRRIR